MLKVKVISLKQPWAYLFCIGAKKFETRSWQARHLGELYVHASQKFYFSDLELCRESPHFAKYIPDPSDGTIVTGAIIGKVNLVEIVPVESIRGSLSDEERAFGDYRDGRYAWRAEGAMLLPKPLPVKGRLSIWDCYLEDELEEFDPDYIGPDPEDYDPDMMGPNAYERAGQMAKIQRDVKCDRMDRRRLDIEVLEGSRRGIQRMIEERIIHIHHLLRCYRGNVEKFIKPPRDKTRIERKCLQIMREVRRLRVIQAELNLIIQLKQLHHA